MPGVPQVIGETLRVDLHATNVPRRKVRSGQQNPHRAFPADGTGESSSETTKFDGRGALAAFSFGPDLRVRADLLSKTRDLSDLWFWYVNCGRGDRRIARLDLATTAPATRLVSE